MLSFITSLPGWVIGFVSGNFELFLGYAICVLFPIPFLNSWIISMWAKLLASETPAPTPVVVTPPAPPTPPTT